MWKSTFFFCATIFLAVISLTGCESQIQTETQQIAITSLIESLDKDFAKLQKDASKWNTERKSIKDSNRHDFASHNRSRDSEINV